MADSNYTLRFNRSAREAYGHDIQFTPDHSTGDWVVGLVVAFAFGFITAMIIFGGAA